MSRWNKPGQLRGRASGTAPRAKKWRGPRMMSRWSSVEACLSVFPASHCVISQMVGEILTIAAVDSLSDSLFGDSP